MPEAVRDLDRDSRLWTVCWSPFSRFLIERTSITAFAACFACGRPETCEKAVLDLDRDPDFGQFAMALLDFCKRENRVILGLHRFLIIRDVSLFQPFHFTSGPCFRGTWK